jgi:hypothetical protein
MTPTRIASIPARAIAVLGSSPATTSGAIAAKISGDQIVAEPAPLIGPDRRHPWRDPTDPGGHAGDSAVAVERNRGHVLIGISLHMCRASNVVSLENAARPESTSVQLMSPSARDSLFFAAVFALVAWTAWWMVKRRPEPDHNPPPAEA